MCLPINNIIRFLNIEMKMFCIIYFKWVKILLKKNYSNITEFVDILIFADYYSI